MRSPPRRTINVGPASVAATISFRTLMKRLFTKKTAARLWLFHFSGMAAASLSELMCASVSLMSCKRREPDGVIRPAQIWFRHRFRPGPFCSVQCMGCMEIKIHQSSGTPPPAWWQTLIGMGAFIVSWMHRIIHWSDLSRRNDWGGYSSV